MEWTTEEEFLAITAGGDRAVLHEVLNRVYNKAIEQALCHIPGMVNKLARKVDAINKFLGEFLTKYPEFKEHKDVVISTVQQFEFEHPELMFDELLEKSVPLIQQKLANLKGAPLCGN